MTSAAIPDFTTIGGAAVRRALSGRRREVIDLVEATYRLHGDGATVNPPSYFLRFPDEPANRIIALPAVVAGDSRVAGMKWISSFPGNIAHGLPRASAVLILNDLTTGYPFACIESSIISASRTAASAALAADRLAAGRERPVRLGLCGAGLIARYVHDYLYAVGFSFVECGVYDDVPDHAARFMSTVERGRGRWKVHRDPESLIRSADLIVFATTAGVPHVHDPSWFDHHPLVLHVSLRDLGEKVIASAVNVVDDVEHCLRADTSLHLVEQRTGSRDHVHATLDDVLSGRFEVPAGRTVIFSPFGLGVLDIAVAKYVYDHAVAAGDVTVADGFFHERQRYGRDDNT